MDFIKDFGIQPILLIGQIVNFVIILFLLKKFFFGPITKMLQERKDKIEQSLKNAAEIEEKLTQTEEKTAKIIEEAQSNAQNLIENAKEQAVKIVSDANLQAKTNLSQTLKDAQSQIELQKAQMQQDLEKETLNLVIEVTNKVLGRTIKSKEKQDLTDKAAIELTGKI